MRKVFIATFLFAALVICGSRIEAQTAPSPAPSPTATPTPDWTVGGFLDASYYTPVASGGTFVFTNGSVDRVFDGVTSGNPAAMTRFVPNAFNFNIRKNTTQGFGGQLEVTLGSDANVINSYGYSATPTYTDVTQLFLYYASGPFTLDVGKFETLAGYEVIESPNDNQISRSILFGFAVPFTHTGARLVYAPASAFTITAGVSRGWDQLAGTGASATWEGAINWTPSKIFSLGIDGYRGQEPSVLTPYPPTAATIYGTRTLIDVVGHWNPSNVWNFGVNYDYAQQTNDQSFTSTGAIVTTGLGVPILGTAKWTGLAGYAVWNASSNVSISGRLETFNDQSGVRTGIAQTWNEGTLTVQYVPTGTNWKLRGEVRNDWSNQSAFARSTIPGTSTTNYASVGAEVIYSFP